MILYLAARYSRAPEISEVARRLRAAGHTIASTWHDRPRVDHPTDLQSEEAAVRDYLELFGAEALVAFTDTTFELFCDTSLQADYADDNKVASIARGGRHVEFGIAVGLGLRLYLVGPRENIFHHLPRVVQCGTVEELIEKLGER